MLVPMELVERRDLRENYDFYYQKFLEKDDQPKLYSEMNEQEKAAWESTVRTSYKEWLGFSDELLDSQKENILQRISEWLFKNMFFAYLVKIENEIIDAHRDPLDRTKINLDPVLRSKNRAFIKETEAENENFVEGFQAYCKNPSIQRIMRF